MEYVISPLSFLTKSSYLSHPNKRHEKHVLCDIYWKARESLYEALKGYQGTSYARSRERYQWTIGTVQHIRNFATSIRKLLYA
jgi:hypothetical protein